MSVGVMRVLTVELGYVSHTPRFLKADNTECTGSVEENKECIAVTTEVRVPSGTRHVVVVLTHTALMLRELVRIHWYTPERLTDDFQDRP